MGAFLSISYQKRQLLSLSDRELSPSLPEVEAISGFTSFGVPYWDGKADVYAPHLNLGMALEESSVLEALIEDQGTSAKEYETSISAIVSWT